MEIENEKIRYSVSRKNFFVKLAVIFMILSALCRFLGYWGFWSNQTAGFVTFQIVLPILCNLLFIVLVLYAGRRFFSLTFIPVILGVMFFIIKAFGFDSILPLDQNAQFPFLNICTLSPLSVSPVILRSSEPIMKSSWIMDEFMPISRHCSSV